MASSWLKFVGLGSLVLVLLPAGAWAENTVKDQKASAVAKLDAQALAARIDEYIAVRWKEEKVKPAGLTDDAEFLRRLYLDLAGRIPRVSEIRAFLADKSPDKRRKAIDHLLEHVGYVNHFANVWRDLIVPQNNNQFFRAYGPQMETWLRGHLLDNTGYDQMVRDLLTADITAQAGQRTNPSATYARAFYLANENKAENIAATTSRLFLGVNLECAQCHDHPFNAYSREQFWEYAAFFAGIQPRNVPRPGVPQRQFDPNAREIQIPGTETTVQARFLDGKKPNWDKEGNPREILVEWMVSPENSYFSRAVVNRVWAQLLGVGIIDPVDEPGYDNPPSHPKLLDELAQQFAVNGFDLKYLIRAIVNSRTYQLTSQLTDPSQEDPRLFARMSSKGLSPEQLYDSVVMATGFRDPNAANRRVGFNRVGMEADFRNKFANFADKRTEYQTSILQALSLMNGKFTADATSIEKSETLLGVIDSPFMDTAQRINTLYLSALSRKMRPDEATRLIQYVEAGGPSGDSKKALADVFWALLNSSEFILNH